MDIKKEHKTLLKGLGLTEVDFEHFDGKEVTYEFDEEKGVRLYDPDYMTSYNEYIDVDGWSAWSSEGDTFMSDVLEKVWAETERKAKAGQRASNEQIKDSMMKKFGAGDSTEDEK